MNEKIRIIFWKFEVTISLKLSDGKKPPPEIKVMVKFKELKSRTPEKLSKVNIIKLKTVQKINIFIMLFFIFSSDLKLLSPEQVKLVILKLKVLLENNNIKKIKKYKPPIHCVDDLQSINVGSKYFIFLKIEKPVPVNPDIASKKAPIKVT